MNPPAKFHSSSRQPIAAMLIYLLICTLYTAVFIYAASILYDGADKLITYFNSCIAAVNNQFNHSLR